MEDESRSVEGMFPVSKPQQIPQNLFYPAKRLGFWCWRESRICLVNLYPGLIWDTEWTSAESVKIDVDLTELFWEI